MATLFVPGSAQIAAGDRRLGWIGVKVWLTVLAVIGALALGLVFFRGPTIAAIAAWPVTVALCALVLAAGFGWAGLFVDAWRIANPPELARKHRPGFALVGLLLALTCVVGSIGTARTVWAQGSLLSSVFTGGGTVEDHQGRINILLLGADNGDDRVGLRPDSMSVASIDAETGRTVLISIPRNLQGAPFPDSSPLKQFYPDGFRCAGEECMINGVYTEATQVHPGLYPPEVGDPGIAATREVVGELLGLDLNYYAMIDLAGFEDMVDALGGIRLNLHKPIPVGGGSSPISRYIEPGENIHLNGVDALWVARSRAESSDYERMERQKCVMAAISKQIDPMTVVTRFTDIAHAGEGIVSTDIPTGEVDKMVHLALGARALDLQNVALVPPKVTPANPDLAQVRSLVAAEIAKAEALDDPSPEPSAEVESATPSAEQTDTSEKADEPSAETSAADTSDEAKPEAQASEAQASEDPESQAPEEPVCSVA